MPRWVTTVLVLLACAALLPAALIARSRSVRSEQPRIHVFPDMDNQERYKAQQANPLFADGRAMRAPVDGTVARGRLFEDSLFYRGIDGDDYAEAIPVEIDMPLLERGRQEYEINCSPCHGLGGYGDGTVARRADELQQGAWVPPSSFHMEPASTRSVGHIFNTITNGIRTMPAYGRQVPAEDRWAIVAYIRALQRSQKATLEDVPVEKRSALR